MGHAMPVRSVTITVLISKCLTITASLDAVIVFFSFTLISMAYLQQLLFSSQPPDDKNHSTHAFFSPLMLRWMHLFLYLAPALNDDSL